MTDDPVLPVPRIAYLTMEAGLENDMRTYSGGLGILAGDTLRAAADMGLPLVGVSLAHREGYFRQSLDAEGRQSDAPHRWRPEEELAAVEERITLPLPGRSLSLRAWIYPVSGVRGDVVPVYLLDADVPENDPEDRKLTDRLYGGDRRYRLLQEAILGMGGAALLRTLGFGRIHTFHMNEGHCALLPLALLEERVAARPRGRVRKEDEAWVRERCTFTTHTPVPAGHDRFDQALVEEVLGKERTRLLKGRGLEDGTLNMTELGMHFSRFTNGVAMRHAQVSREMFPDAEIHAITNGVHVPQWTAPAMADLFDRHVPSWREDPQNLRHACTIPLGELRRARAAAKGALLEAVEARTGRAFSEDVLTLGFARRATPYKRADLLFDEPERLRALAREHGGLQVVYAGKAHPRDEGGQELIRKVHEAARALEGDVDVVWLEDYDMDLGLLLTTGADVWLNNPEKPREASGTSGMKSCLNGVPNLSVLDGWWIEGHVEGVTGWSFGSGWDEPSDRESEVRDLYDTLDRVVLPLYRTDADGFDRVRRNAIALDGPHFSARRMMTQYVDRAYRGGEDVGPTWPDA